MKDITLLKKNKITFVHKMQKIVLHIGILVFVGRSPTSEKYLTHEKTHLHRFSYVYTYITFVPKVYIIFFKRCRKTKT